PVQVAEPALFVTVTSTAPAACAGVFTVIDVAVLLKITPGGFPPIRTLTPVMFVPVIVMDVPAFAGPAFGVMFVIVGLPRYVDAFVSVAEPPTVVAVMSTSPSACAGATNVTVEDVVLVTVAAF